MVKLNEAPSDRLALGTVGVALLRYYGVKGPVSKGEIFNQSQLKRAAKLELGATSIAEIELIGLEDSSKEIIEIIEDIF